MHRIAPFFLFVAVASAHTLFSENNDEWNGFKVMYNKTYQDELDELNHFMTYLVNKKHIEEHNHKQSLGLVSYTMGVNQFTDLTDEEFSQKYLSPMLGDLLKRERSNSKLFKPSPLANIPDAIDWRDKGLVSEVKDQKLCASCYAFSSTGALEGQYAKKTGKIVQFSEQELVDCDEKNGGCTGGSMGKAFDYARQNPLSTEKDYPYDDAHMICRRQDGGIKVSVSDRVSIPYGDEVALKQAVATIGPISIGVHVLPSMRFFKGYHVYHDANCTADHMSHAMLIVGYGTHPTEGDYWIVKNSYGTNFGNQGYINMARNNKNMCGIASYALYPIVD